MNAMEAFNILKAVAEPIGVKINLRNIMIDYHDGRNNYYNREASIIVPPSMERDDSIIVENLINGYAAQGYTVYSIYEMLDGYTNGELLDMSAHNPQEAKKHIKPLYFDMRKERTN